jgi:hypothetical protein
MPEDKEAFNEASRILEFTELNLDLSYVYLRRLADRFIGAVKCLIVTHHASAPSSFTKLRSRIADPVKLKALGPACDADRLASVFRDHCGWFDRLRGTRGRQKPDGLRELMEHGPVTVQVTRGQVGDDPPDLSASIFHPTEEPRFRGNVLSALPEITFGLCRFWAELYPLLDKRIHYDGADYLSCRGLDTDFTAFWPEISGSAPGS